MKPRIKICGLTRRDDLLGAVHAGADAIGLVFYPPSPRHVDLKTAADLSQSTEAVTPSAVENGGVSR